MWSKNPITTEIKIIISQSELKVKQKQTLPNAQENADDQITIGSRLASD